MKYISTPAEIDAIIKRLKALLIAVNNTYTNREETLLGRSYIIDSTNKS